MGPMPFYETYSPNEKLAPRVREIGRAHNLTILERCNGLLERELKGQLPSPEEIAKLLEMEHERY